jgi:branched-chain amino acid transport system substrate-binding protein
MKNQRFLRKLVFVGVVISLLVSLVAFARTSKAETPRATKTITFGINIALSGAAAAWGIPMEHSMKAMAAWVNQKGGLTIGGQKYNINVVEQDNKYDTSLCAAASLKLMDEGATIMYASLTTSDSLAAQEPAEPAKIITVNTADSDWVVMDKKYSFRSYCNPFNSCPAVIGDWLVKEHPGARVAFITQNTESGLSTMETYKNFFAGCKPPISATMVYSDSFEVGTTDFYPFITKMLAAKPDVYFFMAGTPAEWAQQVKQAKELGYKGLFMHAEPGDDSSMVQVLGKDGYEGVLSVGVPLAAGATDEVKAFGALEEQMYGKGDFSSIGFLPVPACLAIFKAMEAAGTTDPDKVVAELYKGKTYTVLGLKGFFGGEKWYGRNAQWYSTQYVMAAKDGVSTPIYEITPAAQGAWDKFGFSVPDVVKLLRSKK